MVQIQVKLPVVAGDVIVRWENNRKPRELRSKTEIVQSVSDAEYCIGQRESIGVWDINATLLLEEKNSSPVIVDLGESLKCAQLDLASCDRLPSDSIRIVSGIWSVTERSLREVLVEVCIVSEESVSILASVRRDDVTEDVGMLVDDQGRTEFGQHALD